MVELSARTTTTTEPFLLSLICRRGPQGDRARTRNSDTVFSHCTSASISAGPGYTRIKEVGQAMGELIVREAAAAPLAFSGARMTSAISGQIEIEHYHRYLLAREYCREKDVLDVASGEGYGSALLAQVARSVIGIEYDQTVVDGARSAFQKANLKFEQGDARSLQLADESIDVALSFETLEHLAEQAQFLSELRRVLRRDGLLIISTPDRDAYSPLGVPPNPFHVRELTRGEFEKLLHEFFPQVAICLQRPMIGSVILGEGTNTPPLCYERRSPEVIEGNDHLARAPYMIAWASGTELPQRLDSVYIYRNDLDTDFQVRCEAETRLREAEASGQAKLHEAETRLGETETNLRAWRAKLQEAETRLETNLRAADGKFEELSARQREEAARAEALAVQLNAIVNSSSWRITRPLRWMGQRLSVLTHAFGQTMKAALRTPASVLRKGSRFARNQRKQRAITAPPLPVQPSTIAIRPHPTPIVSIIIPTFGQVDMTLRCLESIAENAPESAIEVLVVDDAYIGPDDPSKFSQVEGIRLIRNETNLGFLLSCNEASRHACGRYLYFLNNDTLLNRNSVDALVTVLDERPDVGMVGSKLLFPNGELQEAGGIIWSDASGWNYGRGQDPRRPEFNFLRETDYCSGASVMVRRELFMELGGFEPALAPAYYEDVDLAFRLRERGMKVLYQPRSEVVHLEGMSHGTDVTAGVKAHQLVNQRWIVERWGTLLAKEHYANGQHVLRARDRARFGKVILFIDHYVPEPDRDAGSRSIMAVMDSLLDAGWDVKFWPENRGYNEAYTARLEQNGIEVLDNRWPGELAAWLEANGEELDYVLISRPGTAENTLPIILRKTHATLAYFGHDLHFARMRRQAKLTNDAELFKQAISMERRERRVWRNFDVVIYLSDEEANEVKRLEPGVLARAIVPYSFDISPARAMAPATTDILFVAGFAHPPNVDAAKFLIQHILPQLEHAVGPINVVLAGSNPTDEVKALASDRVRVTGYVSDADLAELYGKSRVAIVPLRFGAGVKGKVVEALSYGLPLVTTQIGAQGIPGLAGIVPVHDEPAHIAAAVKRLLMDDGVWHEQSRAQLDFAHKHFSPEGVRNSVLAALSAGEALWHGPSQERSPQPYKAAQLNV